MEHIAAFLLIVGCSGDAGTCRELPAPVPVYETLEQCQADLQPSISLFTTRVPQVVGRCIAVDPALEETDAELVWDVGEDGNLVAGIEPVSPVMVAANGQHSDDTISRE